MKHSWCDFLYPESFRSQGGYRSHDVSTNLIFCWADFRSAARQSFWSSAARREARDSSPQPGTCRGSTAAASSSGIVEINEDPGPGVLVGSASWATSAALRASVRTSSSALILSSRAGWPSPNLKTTRCFVHHSDNSWRVRKRHAMCKCKVFLYPDTWPAFWQSAVSRSRCFGLAAPIPVFRIRDCTLYSLMTVFMPGTWDTRTWRKISSKQPRQEANKMFSAPEQILVFHSYALSECNTLTEDLPWGRQTQCVQGWEQLEPGAAHHRSSDWWLGWPEQNKLSNSF